MATVTLRRKELERALKLAAKVTPRRCNLPVLGNARLTVNGAVRLAVTDLEYGAVLDLVRAGGEGNADMLLPVGRLLAQVRAGRGETVTLEPGDGWTARLDGTAAVVGMDPAEFPTLPSGPEGELVGGIDGAELVEALRAVEFAVSGEVVRYALTGVLMEFEAGKKGRACLVASDGKRLARWRLRGVSVARDARLIVPTKALQAVVDLVGRPDKGGIVKVYVEVPKVEAKEGEEKKASDMEPTRIHFALPQAGVFSRVVEGNFPDHEAVTPADLPGSWTMDRKELAEAIKTVLPATTDKTRAVRFTLRASGVELFAKSADVGEATATVRAQGTPDELAVVLNPEYVLDYLAGLPRGVERVVMHAKAKDCAVVWRGAAGHEYVQMPLTVNL